MIGIGGSYLGGKAMLDFLKLDSALNPDILFAGNDLSSSKMIEISDFIKNEEYAIVMTSKSGKTLEPSLSFEYFVDKLKQQKPTNYAERVLVITEKDSLLDNAATAAGYLKSEFIDGIGGRFSGLTPLGLIPAMFKGVNYKDIIIGAKKANKDLISDPVNASAYKYATTRYLLSKKLTTEFFIAYESENLTLLD
ncbi:MAG: hypothetical protein DRP42_00450 [Tenericutes bacterium]|nr:MAG: hypothetical protein DRP42_00450 [Mycoplasmatota bacterium]